MKTKLLLIIIFITSLKVVSQTKNCEEVLNKKIILKNKKISSSDLNTLKNCGYDFEKYEHNVIQFAIAVIYSKNEELTYRNLITKADEINSKTKDQMVISTFKLFFIFIVLLALVFWLVLYFKNRKQPNNN